MRDVCLLFDLDETLISHRHSIARFVDYQYNEFYTSLKHIPFLTWRSAFLEREKNGYVTKDIVYAELIELFPIELSADTLYAHFLEHFHKYTVPYENTNALIHSLRLDGYKLGLITNGGTLIQERKIKQLGYAALFDVIVISESIGYEKPARAIFEHALTEMRTSAEKCIFIGDHPINDIFGAKQLGMRSVWIAHNKAWTESAFSPDFIVNTPHDLDTHLQTILQMDASFTQ
ncbi:MAG: HAD family hydrolase [Bacilli bacterium]